MGIGSDERRSAMIRIIIIFVALYFLILVTRFVVVEDIDLGFSLIISVVLTVIYIVLLRLVHYLRTRKES